MLAATCRILTVKLARILSSSSSCPPPRPVNIILRSNPPSSQILKVVVFSFCSLQFRLIRGLISAQLCWQPLCLFCLPYTLDRSLNPNLCRKVFNRFRISVHYNCIICILFLKDPQWDCWNHLFCKIRFSCLVLHQIEGTTDFLSLSGFNIDAFLFLFFLPGFGCGVWQWREVFLLCWVLTCPQPCCKQQPQVCIRRGEGK